MSDQTRSPALAVGERAPDLVLRAAHIVVTVAASIAFIAIIVVGIATLAYTAGTWAPAPHVTIPPRYTPAGPTIDPAQVARFLAPPTEVTLVGPGVPLDPQVPSGILLGRLQDQSPGGTPAFPDAFRIVGGSGAADTAITQRGVVATRRLASRIARAWAETPRPTAVHFTLVVLATSRFGVSSRQAIYVSLPLAVSGAQPAKPPAPPVASPKKAGPKPLTKLQSIARTYAKSVDPHHTPVFFAAYQDAYALPSRCGASGKLSFLVGFQDALTKVRAQLNAQSGPTFLNLVCSSWNASIQKQNALITQADIARRQAFARRQALYYRAQAARAVARVKRNAALLVLAAVIGAFVVIALLLAFLAIERHTRMLGAMVQRLATQATAGGLPSAASPGSTHP